MIKRLCLLLMTCMLVLNFTACDDSDSDSGKSKKSKKLVEETEETMEVENNEENEDAIKVENDIEDKADNETAESDDTEEESSNDDMLEPQMMVETGVNLVNNMDYAARTTLNTFLSNFSETYFQNYPVGGIADNYNLISFAFTHNLLNSSDKIIYTAEHMGISGTDVDATLYRFFGKSVPHTSVNEWAYMNDGFYMPGASGEFYAFFSIAKEMYPNNDGTYTVHFDTFSDDSNPDSYMNSWYSLTHQQALSRYNFCESGTAVVRSKTVNGKSSYELVSYIVQ